MKKSLVFLILPFLFMVTSCNQSSSNKNEPKTSTTEISKAHIDSAIDELVAIYGESHKARITKGVSQIAKLWRTVSIDGSNTDIDGDQNDFNAFCKKHFVADSAILNELFNSTQTHLEVILGHFNKVSLDLKRPVHLDNYKVTSVDELIAGWDPTANIINDLFANKVAFIVALNFPYYTLEEKEKLGEKWNRKEWAYARLGDIFTTRVPSALTQKYSECISSADFYISNYNILVGELVDDKMQKHFPKDLKLITHWNLRDEIKSQYADTANGIIRQKMLFEVMQRIVKQEIPECVINSDKYQWNPFTNKVYQSQKEVKWTPEPNTRYQHILNAFKANQAIDKYRTTVGNLINSTFDIGLEMPQPEVEKLFVDFISSPLVAEVAALIKQRLNRPLEPFDIWYDGFKLRSSIDQVAINKRLAAMYPNTTALKKGLPTILKKLGFTADKANYIVEKIDVDASKGAGHAWGAEMRGEKAHLRTRIGKDGIDYKGYNIAIHEFGHNVEQTLTLYDVDYWMLKGVPNTAFTEAWAFCFQAKDLQLLGIKNNNELEKHYEVLDKFWSNVEAMGISLVDQKMWQWLYNNPNATKNELHDAVINIANEIWNKYFSPHFGIKDCPILAIYSHMIDYPLYLSAYPIGHLIEFQISDYIKDKNLGTEMQRICSQGRLTPNTWMQNAVGSKVSSQPLLNATTEALTAIKNKNI